MRSVSSPSAQVTSTAGTLAFPRRAARLLVRICLAAACGFAAAIAVSISVPTLLGYQSFTVLSGSMVPALGVGDVVIVSKLAPLDARIGDIVTFRSPEDRARLVTHRVLHMRASGATVYFETKGDANTGTEKWSVATSGVIGRAAYRVPKVGYVTNRLGSRLGRLSFIVLPALLLGLFELRRIWRPRKT